MTLSIGALFVYHDANVDPTIQKINTFKEAQIVTSRAQFL